MRSQRSAFASPPEMPEKFAPALFLSLDIDAISVPSYMAYGIMELDVLTMAMYNRLWDRLQGDARLPQ